MFWPKFVTDNRGSSVKLGQAGEKRKLHTSSIKWMPKRLTDWERDEASTSDNKGHKQNCPKPS